MLAKVENSDTQVNLEKSATALLAGDTQMFTLETVMWRLLAEVSNSGHSGPNHPRQTPRSPNHPSLRVVSRERETARSAAPQDRTSARATATTNQRRSPTGRLAIGRARGAGLCPVLSWTGLTPLRPLRGWSRVTLGHSWGCRGLHHLIMNQHLVIRQSSFPVRIFRWGFPKTTTSYAGNRFRLSTWQSAIDQLKNYVQIKPPVIEPWVKHTYLRLINRCWNPNIVCWCWGVVLLLWIKININRGSRTN